MNAPRRKFCAECAEPLVQPAGRGRPRQRCPRCSKERMRQQSKKRARVATALIEQAREVAQ